MNIQFTFKHMTSSQALSDLISEKLSSRVEKFTARPVHAHVTFSVEGLLQKIHVSLITADGHDIEAEHSGSDMYAECDVVAEKVEAQLRKHKERLKDHKGESVKVKLATLNLASVEPVDDSVADDAIDADEVLRMESQRKGHGPTHSAASL